MLRFRYSAVFVVCIGALVLAPVTGCGGGSSTSLQSQEASTTDAFRSVPIREVDGAYFKMDSQVVRSQAELDRLILAARETGGEEISPGVIVPRWFNEEEFVRRIDEANIDFTKEALVLLRQFEGGGGLGVSLEAPRLQGTTLVSTIRVFQAAEGGGAAVSAHLFALVVRKSSVKDVAVAVDNEDPRGSGTILMSVSE